jgi:3,4-dihydroxy 2-butanone 4-phosphate synthase
MTFDTAIASLKQGEFVMIYDSDGRESEVDLMVAAEFCTPERCDSMLAVCFVLQFQMV